MELLAVVLILAVLAAVAVPLYLSSRKTSAARACKANINAIASAESAYVVRNGAYADLPTLSTNQPEGLSGVQIRCPLDGGEYTGLTPGSGPITITCPNASEHQIALSGSSLAEWQHTMAAVAADVMP